MNNYKFNLPHGVNLRAKIPIRLLNCIQSITMPRGFFGKLIFCHYCSNVLRKSSLKFCFRITFSVKTSKLKDLIMFGLPGFVGERRLEEEMHSNSNDIFLPRTSGEAKCLSMFLFFCSC